MFASLHAELNLDPDGHFSTRSSPYLCPVFLCRRSRWLEVVRPVQHSRAGKFPSLPFCSAWTPSHAPARSPPDRDAGHALYARNNEHSSCLLIIILVTLLLFKKTFQADLYGEDTLSLLFKKLTFMPSRTGKTNDQDRKNRRRPTNITYRPPPLFFIRLDPSLLPTPGGCVPRHADGAPPHASRLRQIDFLIDPRSRY